MTEKPLSTAPSTALPAERAPPHQAITARNRSEPRRVTGRLRIAIERMVWHGDKRADAAAFAKMGDHGLRAALRKPHVKSYYLGELDTLRNSERPRNVHALVDVRDTSENAMARVQAARALEQSAIEQAPFAGANERPGLYIVVLPAQPLPAPATAGPVTIEHEPREPLRESDDDQG